MNRSARNGDPQSLDQTIPQRIRSLRESLNLTAAALERVSGLGTGTIGRLERGEQRVYANHLYRIARATGVEAAWFYGEESGDGSHDRLRTEQQRLLGAYLRITDSALKRGVFELVEALSKPGKH